MHNGKYGRVIPKTNARFWHSKRLANKARDKKNIRALKRLGWQILILWECRTRNRIALQTTLQNFLSH